VLINGNGMDGEFLKTGGRYNLLPNSIFHILIP